MLLVCLSVVICLCNVRVRRDDSSVHLLSLDARRSSYTHTHGSLSVRLQPSVWWRQTRLCQVISYNGGDVCLSEGACLWGGLNLLPVLRFLRNKGRWKCSSEFHDSCCFQMDEMNSNKSGLVQWHNSFSYTRIRVCVCVCLIVQKNRMNKTE